MIILIKSMIGNEFIDIFGNPVQNTASQTLFFASKNDCLQPFLGSNFLMSGPWACKHIHVDWTELLKSYLVLRFNGNILNTIATESVSKIRPIRLF